MASFHVDQRQADAETGALAGGAFHLDAASVRLNDALADGQPKPGTAIGAIARIIGAVKSVKEMALVFKRDARALIGHLDHSLALNGPSR